MRTFLAALAAVVVALAPMAAHAFCGFYVTGADARLYANATMVVLMREGNRTVLSMQNHYQGPPQDFAMVIPVPVVLQRENVKTLEDEVFARVDHLAAPRLVEYWEQDPCSVHAEDFMMAQTADEEGGMGRRRTAREAVRIEAQFTVGEYEIVILSADDSLALDTWLRDNRYRIPDGAEPVLRPYVQAGMKFFVAKVNVERVRFENGQAMLSPLRFHYDSDEFSLPVRLGLLNSSGVQDLIVHILAPGQRYELANYRNVTIPTNIDVDDSVRRRFPEFYAALYDRTLERNPRAVVTEYAWQATSCDPCPGPVLSAADLITLGADVLSPETRDRLRPFVLTRLHARYSRDALGEDLVFRPAPPIAGGREHLVGSGPDRRLEEGSRPDDVNNFQARYAIRHPWTGPITCENPVRGEWGGRPGRGDRPVAPATDLAFAPRGRARLEEMVKQNVPEIGLTGIAAAQPSTSSGGVNRYDAPAGAIGGCGCDIVGYGAPGWGLLALIGVGLGVAIVVVVRRAKKK